MTDKQEEKLSRFYAIRQFCEKKQAVWEDYLPFARSFACFAALLPQIEQNRDIQMTDITGVTIDKQNLQQELIDKTWMIASRVQSFAKVNEIENLVNAVKLTRSTLIRSNNSSLIGWSVIIGKNTGEYIGQLEPYGILQQDLDELDDLTGRFSKIVSSIDDASDRRKTATYELKRLFRETMATIGERLDLDAQYFKDSDAGFYDEYIAVRGLKKRGRKKRKKTENEMKMAG